MNFAANFVTNNDRSQQQAGAGAVPGQSQYQVEEQAYRDAGPANSDASSHSSGTIANDGTAAKADQHHQEQAEETRRDAAVLKLARAASRLSTHSNATGGANGPSGDPENPFGDDIKDRKLDPSSPNFSARAYAQAVLHQHSKDRNAVPIRRAGVAFRGLNVHGYGSDTDYQKTVGNAPLGVVSMLKGLLGSKGKKIDILQDFDGLVKAGSMCVVLGPPGSGCSTLLKTICGETHGLFVDDNSYLNYQGISQEMMYTRFRGEAIYTAETDVHFPNLTVGQTLSFAAEARAPRQPLSGLTRKQYAEHARDVIMAIFGISHTINTRVGNDFVRGVSGGERKRVSISEAALAGAPLQCWDNSTRGLDSANAVEFCKTLRVSADLSAAAALVAIYQAPASAYEIFDTVTVLYEGRQIYFGPIHEAEGFFHEMGFDKPSRQTVPDFLTSLTSPQERRARQGFEDRVPRTPDEFAARWKESRERQKLLADIEAFDKEYPIGGDGLAAFQESRQAQQAKGARKSSPYTLSYMQQIGLCLRRGFWRLKADPSLTLTQ